MTAHARRPHPGVPRSTGVPPPWHSRLASIATLVAAIASVAVSPLSGAGLQTSAPGATRARARVPDLATDSIAASRQETPGYHGCAEGWLPPGHWVEGALSILANHGLVDAGSVASVRPMRRSRVRALLESAAARTASRPRSALDRLTRTVRDRFEQDSAVPNCESASLVAAVRPGLIASRGTMLAGTARRESSGAWVYPGPTTGPGYGPEPLLGLNVEFATKAGAFAQLALRSRPGSSEAEAAYVGMVFGPITGWVGRRAFGIGPGRSGSIVLNDASPITGAGLSTTQPVHLPGFLSYVGAVELTAVLSRFRHSGSVDRPWFVATRVSFAPSAAVAIGLNRAAVFGGAGNVEPMSARNIALALFGLTGQLGKDSGFENQIASVDLRLHSRLAGLPLVLYGEWGADDVGLSFARTTALLLGLDAALPFAPGTSVGVEGVSFPASCCGHPPWYRHGDLGDGWTRGGRILGHPLGGHGSQLSVHARSLARSVSVEAWLYARRRGEENLLYPDRGGRSVGVTLRAHAFVIGPARLLSVIDGERGHDWSTWRMRIQAELVVPRPGRKRGQASS